MRAYFLALNSKPGTWYDTNATRGSWPIYSEEAEDYVYDLILTAAGRWVKEWEIVGDGPTPIQRVEMTAHDAAVALLVSNHDDAHQEHFGPIAEPEAAPEMLLRSVRVDDEVWQAAKRVAAAHGMSVSDLVRTGLTHEIATRT